MGRKTGAFVAAGVVIAVSAQGALADAKKPIATSGMASYYGYSGRTANGERHSAKAMTADHRSLPFGTMVKVTNQSNGKSVVLRINDRGPFVRGRIVDVSTAAAESLGFRRQGVAKVTVAVID